jgi:hypothetical protein
MTVAAALSAGALLPIMAPIRGRPGVPSLFRFLFIIGTLAGLVYLGIYALANFVTPQPHQITETVPIKRLNK